MASSMLTADVSALASTEADVDEALNCALHACANDPDFAIICDFLQKFSKDLGLDLPNFKLLLQWLTKTDEVSSQLREMQIKLLRKTRKTVHEKSWESALSKFCFTYSAQDGWEIERFGYKNSSVKVKLRILKELLESQFERNTKFRAKILTLSADSLRSKPIGRDRQGHAYWLTQDNDCNIRIYQEHLDEEIWQVVATNRDEFVNLIKLLRGSEVVVPCKDISIIDEDTTSSISRIDSYSAHKSAPPEEKDDSQEDEQKVPKLSIKLVQGKSFNELNNHKDVGKGEEELAAEEDAKLLRKSIGSEAVESGEEEFEEIEEEYDDESGSEIESDDEIKLYKMKNVTEHEPDTKTKEDNKKVKPLLISQNKVFSSKTAVASCYSAKKRGLDQVDSNSPPRNVIQSANALQKLRPSLLDSKRAKTSNKYDDNKEQSEEDYEESEDEDSDVEEEIEEEDIDSVAAEEDENEEKLFVDYDDYDEEEPEVGVEISDPVVHVKGEGSGKGCDVGNYLCFIDSDLDFENLNILSEVIVEDVFYVQGGGSGLDCLVGNNKNDEEDDDDNTVKSIAEVTKTNVDTKSKTDLISLTQKENERLSKQSATNKNTNNAIGDLTEKKEKLDLHSEKLAENLSENDKEENPKKEISQINGENKTINEKYTDPKTTNELLSSESKNTQHEKLTEVSSKADNQITCKNLTSSNTETTTIDVLTQKTHATKMSALESLKKELRESKQKLLEKKLPTTSERSNLSTSIYNRKRRLTDQLQVTVAKPANSESEVDLNSENAEDLHNEQDPEIEDDGDLDVGGKRLKIRPKQSNTELRKKIEAQKVAANDETTSSSGGEEELRRRKKIILSKQTATSPLIKTEEIFKNFENKKEGVAIKKATQFTPTKVKPALAEIIEKKLKKTSEKFQNDKSDVDGNVVQTLFSSINKSPITKPLKKNLLTQIMQEESDAHAIPRKCTNSQELDATLKDIKPVKTSTKNVGETTISKTDVEKPRPKPERQRKRRSSEETVQIDNPEEPEAKKEVSVIKENEVSLKFKETSQSIKEEEKEGAKDIEIKMECLIPVSGRRSGRRSGVAPIYVDSLQSQKNRCYAKNSTKTEDLTESNKVETIETKSPRKDNKNKNKKQDNEKSEGDKSADGKSSLLPKETDSAEVMSKRTTNAMETSPKFDISKSKTIPSIKTSPKGTRKKREVDAINIIDIDSETPVRQSRRIAQQKIREEAERRKLEEIALRSMKQELKKKKKAEKQSDPTVVPPTEPSSDSEESDVETKKKVQKKKWPGKNGNWSSGSEEQEEPDDEDEEPPHYETDPGSPLFKSDHEFSPESDIEDESQVVPMKRARTVRKEDADDDATAADEEEEACQKCNKSDHPEWILLCDNCDKGYHCSCLSPVLFYIPEGDWYCPPCQQEQLIRALENQLKEFDDLVENKKKAEEHEKRIAEEEKLRKEREEESKKHTFKKGKRTNANRNTNDNSSGNEHSQEGGDEEQSTSSDESEHSETKKKTIKNNKNSNRSRNSKNSEKRNHRERRKIATRGRRNRKQSSDSDSDSEQLSKSNSESKSSSSSSSTYSESDNEPIYKLRKRRQINVSYRLNEYDDLINSALKKEMDEAAGAGNLGRGKDISTIIEADKEEKARQKQIEDGEIEVSIVKEIPKETKQDGLKTELKETKTTEEKKECIGEDEEKDSDVEPIIRKLDIKQSQKKKPRKLTTLDISSEDDHGSDEDFKGSSLDDEEEDTSISASNSDSSLEIYKRHSKSKKKRRKAARKAFRERRKDRRFLVDDSDDEEVQRPKSKKKRKDDSDYTESEADDDISELSENIDSADLCDDTTTDESDGAWRPNKRKKTKKSNTSFMQKSPKSKNSKTKKPKKVEYSDDDVSDSEEDEDDDDNEGGVSGKGMGKQPRSQPLKTTSSSTKIKGKGKEKPPVKTKKKKHLSEDEVSKSEDSEDSTRRTRGRRYAYIEDFDDDSSDGGIKPGVQRPDTPPEEREKFIKRQEEIKRMLAEKNAEGAKLVATPRLTPIKTDGEKDKRSPAKAGDSLSTVPLSVIRQAKVLDIDYLQRRGENLDDLTNDVGEVDDEFDDADLPDDLPEDMDEDAIARMVEEEEEFGGAAARELPAPDEVLRTINTSKPTKTKEAEKPLLPPTMPSTFLPNSPQVQPVTLPTSTLTSGLQEPVRRRLPMPTMHPPLLRHQFIMHDSISNPHNLLQRHGGPPPTSHLLQNALSAPLSQPLDRNYPPTPLSASHHSLINRMAHSIPLQPTVPHVLSTTRPSQLHLASSIVTKASPLLNQPAQEKPTIPQTVPENKPRGRRKKITPLRDTLQKQQTAAAVTAATATSSALASSIVKNNEQSVCTSLLSSVIKSSSTAKLQMQASVITSMPPTTHSATSRPGITIPSISGTYVRSDGPRFYDAPGNRVHQSSIQRHRGPPQMPPSLLPPHPANRSTYGPPPPLKGSNSGPPVSSPSNSSGSVRNPLHHVPPPYLSMPPNARHASPHLNMYRPPMYGNPNFGPRVNLRPPNMHAPEFSTGSRTYPPYGFYPPPPPLTTPGQRTGPVPRSSTQIPPVASNQKHPPPASVIVSASSTKSLNAPLAKPQATPPSTPEITEPISSTKPILAARELPIKVTSPKLSSPTPVAPQTGKAVTAPVNMTEPRKKLTTLQAYTTNSDKKSQVRPTCGSSGSQSSPNPSAEVNDDSSAPGPSDNTPTAVQLPRPEGHASEFSGLVSYFSSQHDDYNT